MTNYESGKYIAQKFSHHIIDLLDAIYIGTVEPQKPLNDFEKGVLDEVEGWNHFSNTAKLMLEKIRARAI